MLLPGLFGGHSQVITRQAQERVPGRLGGLPAWGQGETGARASQVMSMPEHGRGL